MHSNSIFPSLPPSPPPSESIAPAGSGDNAAKGLTKGAVTFDSTAALDSSANSVRQARTLMRQASSAAVSTITAERGNIPLTQQRKAKGKCLIHPSDTRLGIWDTTSGLLLIYTALICPFEVSFLSLPVVGTYRFVMNRFIDAFFAVDMVVQLFVMFPEERPVAVYDESDSSRKLASLLGTQRTTLELVTSHKAIAIHYLTGWFAIDLISILTCVVDIYPAMKMASSTGDEPIADAAQVDSSIDDLRIFRILRVLRMLKLVRILKSSRLIKRWRTAIALDFSTQTILFCVSAYLLAAHWFACILVLTSDFEDSPMHSWRAAKGYCVEVDDPELLPPRRTWIRKDLDSLGRINKELENVYCLNAWGMWVSIRFPGSLRTCWPFPRGSAAADSCCCGLSAHDPLRRPTRSTLSIG